MSTENKRKGLVTAKEIAAAINFDKFGVFGTFVGWVLMKVLKISKVNKIYIKHKHKPHMEFMEALANEFKLNFEIPDEDFKRLPKEGAYITVSNHPLGGIDGMLLLLIMLKKRPDFKIIANFLLHRIEPVKEFMMPVNPFENRKDIRSSVAGFKNAILHLRNGHPLGVFPAGEVSTHRDGKLIVDKPWEDAAIKLIQKSKVPVVPIYFHAENSKLFYKLSKISDTFRSAKLPSELLTQKRRVIKVRIGKPITVEKQNEYNSVDSLSEYLRRKTYMLSNSFDEKGNLKVKIKESIPSLKIPKSPKNIIKALPSELIENDVDGLRKGNFRLLESKNYEVFLAPANKIKYVLQEIGRLREVTFREIGEGTNKSIDLDKYDSYYHHLFLWDNSTNAIAGAYRMGLGSEIFKNHGIKGFYLSELFKFDGDLHTMMSESIEMGRAFIIPEYQQKPMPLFLLWKGIVHTTLRYPNHNYLIGGVSISNKFTNFSKSLMIEFMKSHFYDPYVAQYVSPKKEFKVKLKDSDKDFVFDASKADLNKFDKIIEEVEPGNLRLPVLIKKYIKQNARVVAFNVDPLFNNAIDGLMYIRISDLPESTVKPVMEEFQAELEKRYNKEVEKV
jgi:putative hemolysin